MHDQAPGLVDQNMASCKLFGARAHQTLDITLPLLDRFFYLLTAILRRGDAHSAYGDGHSVSW